VAKPWPTFEPWAGFRRGGGCLMFVRCLLDRVNGVSAAGLTEKLLHE